MPKIAPRNYLAKIDEFAAHWGAVNTALGSALVLSGNYAVATLATGRGTLVTSINNVVAAVNTHESASAARDTLRASLGERFRQFNALVRGAFPGSGWANQLPRIPRQTEAPGVWMKAMSDVADIWSQINNADLDPPAPSPLILAGGYTRATFVTDQTALNADFTAVENAMQGVNDKVRARDVIWLAIYNHLKEYRLQVQGRFASGAALLDSLPALTPPAGHTPDAVSVNAAWDAGLAKAVVTYTASTDPDLASYELRGCIGGTRYDTDTESVFATHAAGTVTPFATATGLVASGSKVWYKVYVVLTTSNEKASKAVSVTRP